ncbi:hypothetical protein [Vibrio hangzhouensis]|uniref:3-demethylubiquinone-9 3-methyltransferase n=1 Tax=Vibrio hangzhouensis TaxID=462991 RepID=A0A1H6BPJ3_9VIBR|nr:hypothetical protein [Vibrio hangzhouensis]MBY6197824.1 hypothetical protein [Vibrio hangzhouensis]SEG62649.1 hypothetical protein SAMN04488244_12440 [Vibrio hangzhouensis]
MEAVISQLKKDFYAHLKSSNGAVSGDAPQTISLLTKEELAELENIWVELAVWKQKQAM